MNLITERHNYNQDGYIGLVDIPLPKLPPTLEVGKLSFMLKTEFHISLLWAARIAKLISPDNAKKVEQELVDFFVEFTKSKPLINYELTNDVRLYTSERGSTVIVMVKMPELSDLFEALEQKYQTAIPIQPTHITLYTLTLNAGIGILAPQELNDNSHAIDTELRFS